MTPSPEAADQVGPRSHAHDGLRGAARLTPWIGVVAAGAWTAWPSPWWLVVVAAAVIGGALGPVRSRSPARASGLILLLAVVLAGFLAHERLHDLRQDWPAYWDARETAVFERLQDELADLVDRGNRTASNLAELAEAHQGHPPWERVRRLRDRSGFAAVAVYGPEGDLQVWDGTHRGLVPEEVQRGMAEYAYGELPLFGYMYFTYPVPSVGGTAVVAALVRTDLPGTLMANTGDLASRLRSQTGETVRFSGTERVGQAAFDYVFQGDTLFSVTVDAPTPADRIAAVRLARARWILAFTFLAWLTLTLAGRGDPAERTAACLALVLLAFLVPFGPLLGVDELFGPATFLLPGPLDFTLGRVLAVGLALAAGAALAPRRVRRVPVPVAMVLVALGFPAIVAATLGGASARALGGPEADWVTFELTATVLLTLLAAGGLGLARDREDRGGSSGPRRVLVGLAGAALLAVGLGAVVAARARMEGTAPWWVAGVWAFPAGMAAYALGRWRRWRHGLLSWGVAIVLGTTAALPFAWGGRMQARMTMAESQMNRLGADVDPYLDFLLGRMARVVDSLDARGAIPAEILYRGWVEAGLAREGYPIWLTLWSSGGLPIDNLSIGVAADRPPVAISAFEEAQANGTTVIRRLDAPNAHYLLGVPLRGGRVVTGVVPPLEDVGTAPSLRPLLGEFYEEQRNPLSLVPLREDTGAVRLPPAARVATDSLRWIATPEGWRGETTLAFPGERYHAHYLIEVPGRLVIAARATLLLVLNLTVLLAVWAFGRLVFLDVRPGGQAWKPLVTSFRARVTLALFAFFVLSNAIFGTLAFRTISGAAERAAAVLAERVVEDAAGVYGESGGSLDYLAGQVGADILEYRGGELREGSAGELVELGLYEGWMPFPVYRSLSARENVMTTDEQALGRWEYVRAFRLLPDDDVLAAPVPLQAGATAVRRREVADLLGFAVVAGGLLSLVLALLVGRTLARPIQTLQVASERVGSGNLGVHLPADRSDEFGAVFGAFNRMVRRLRRARRDLVRTSRRTQAIVEDAATGVIALGSGGRVALVNRRALELLGRSVEVGDRLREEGGDADEFVRWIRLYFRDGLREAGTEFQFGERRVRVRARRISREGSLGGAVLSLEDVTDELRTERVLAWGEMARQVAHEVKNPLTPIKLSIQHIRRAFDDRHPDFDDILTRNADAALREIDRLAAIASSFSRFGAPEEAGQTPLRPVRLEPVVQEVLALYVSGEGGVHFDADVDPDLPPVQARPSEVKEVLVNLMENSRAAIDEEGRVMVRAGGTPDAVVLTVQDDGSGIPRELLPRVFEPHFSTRSAGTGLGLAIVKRLVESWGAAVTMESEPGRGTAVHLWLKPWDERVQEGDGGGVHAPDG